MIFLTQITMKAKRMLQRKRLEKKDPQIRRVDKIELYLNGYKNSELLMDYADLIDNWDLFFFVNAGKFDDHIKKTFGNLSKNSLIDTPINMKVESLHEECDHMVLKYVVSGEVCMKPALLGALKTSFHLDTEHAAQIEEYYKSKYNKKTVLLAKGCHLFNVESHYRK